MLAFHRQLCYYTCTVKKYAISGDYIMSKWAIALGIFDIIVCVILIFVVLFQHGRSANLSGTIAGGAETFFGKNKGRTIDALLSKWTTIIAFLFVIVTVILNGLKLAGKI